MLRNETEDDMIDSIDFKKSALTMSQAEKDSIQHEEFLKSMKVEIYTSLEAEKRLNKLKEKWLRKNKI